MPSEPQPRKVVVVDDRRPCWVVCILPDMYAAMQYVNGKPYWERKHYDAIPFKVIGGTK